MTVGRLVSILGFGFWVSCVIGHMSRGARGRVNRCVNVSGGILPLLG